MYYNRGRLGRAALDRRAQIGGGSRAAPPRGLDSKNLHHLSQVFRSRPSARQRGVIKKSWLAKRSLTGLRRSLARGLDPKKLASSRQVSWVKTVRASARRYQEKLASEAEPHGSEAQPR